MRRPSLFNCGEGCRRAKKKGPSPGEDPVFLRLSQSDGAGNLAGTQAAGAGVNALRGAVHDRLDASDVRLPGSVRTSMGMGHLNAKRNILATNFTLCHVCTSFEDDIIGLQHSYFIRFSREKQVFFQFFPHSFANGRSQTGIRGNLLFLDPDYIIIKSSLCDCKPFFSQRCAGAAFGKSRARSAEGASRPHGEALPREENGQERPASGPRPGGAASSADRGAYNSEKAGKNFAIRMEGFLVC